MKLDRIQTRRMILSELKKLNESGMLGNEKRRLFDEMESDRQRIMRIEDKIDQIIEILGRISSGQNTRVP